MQQDRRRAIELRAQYDAERAVVEAILRIQEAGLTPTGSLIEAYVKDIACPRLVDAFTREVLAELFELGGEA
jgi:hypothetical protein